MAKTKERWGTRVGLILAMAGNAVGLGNFLRFPMQAVENGGGTFIIPYLICFLVMGIPLLWIEWSMGRFGGKFGHHSTPFILDNMTKRAFWKYFGVFGIFTNIAVAAYYCYIESWTMSYVYHSVIQTFSEKDQTAVANFFNNYVDIGYSTTGIPYEAVIFYVFCLALNTWILSRGLKNGVEKAAKIGMPLLILFGIFLAIRAVTLGDTGLCLDCNSAIGLNFLWEPQFESLWDFKVWLAAAGQIFFTLSLGMGTIHCYASYVKANDDIALNAMSAGWMNGFVEIVLGASVVIPIAVGYLGLDWVRDNAGFSMAFQTMPFLFNQWGVFLATLAGVMWFGLLFFAGITSSLAMGTPWMGFMEGEFNWTRNKSAWTFGLVVLAMGLPTVFFFNQGVFNEYDYWAGTVSLVVFALAEVIIFAYIFGIKRGWAEINEGSEIKVPIIFRYLMVTVTPLLLAVVFIGALVKPVDWEEAIKGNWVLADDSIIGKIAHKGLKTNQAYFADYKESDVEGQVESIIQNPKTNKTELAISQNIQYYRDTVANRIKQVPTDLTETAGMEIFDSLTLVKKYRFQPSAEIIVEEGEEVQPGTHLAKGNFINNVFYLDMSRLWLAALFIFISILVFRATKIREKSGRIS